MATVIAAHAMFNPLLECSVCYQMFNDPRMLQCGHTFCLQCLEGIVNTVASKTTIITCPQCRTESSVNSQNLQDVPKNFTVAQLVCSLPATSQCVNGCQHGSAQHVCLDCWDALCDTCSKVHTMTKLTKAHTVKLLRELTTDDIQAKKLSKRVFCESHPKQEVATYCDNCQSFACITCIGLTCKRHKCLEFSDADAKFTATIRNTLKPLQEISSKFDAEMNEMSLAIEQSATYRDTLQNDIDNLLSGTESKLRKLYKELLEKIKLCRVAAKLTVNKSHDDQMSKLQASLADKQKQSGNIKQHVASVEHHLTPSSSVFDKSKFIKSKLSDIESETKQAKKHMGTFLHSNSSKWMTDTSKWKTDMNKWKTDLATWLENISDTLTTATERLPPLPSKHSVDVVNRVTAAKHKHNFTVEQIKDGIYGVTTLSVSSEGQLLVGLLKDRQLHVYSAEGTHVTSINLLDGDTLGDAVWTPRGHILYTADNSNKVVVKTQHGDVLAQTKTLFPFFLSSSTDDFIYLADHQTGIYQSTNDGVTWSHVFKVADGWRCVQVIKVSSDSNTQVFWTAEKLIADNTNWQLRVYTVDKQRVHNNVTRRDVTLPSHITVKLQYSRLAYDGYTNMFVMDSSNKAVHVWSVSGQYVYQLVFSQQLVHRPTLVRVDSQRSPMMYVGQHRGTVGVFELTYELIEMRNS